MDMFLPVSLPSGSPRGGLTSVWRIKAFRAALHGLFVLALASPAVAGPNGVVPTTRTREGAPECGFCVAYVVAGGCGGTTPRPVHGGVRPLSAARAAAIDFGIYQRLREESLLETPAGRHFTDLYDTHTSEMTDIALSHAEAFDAARSFLSAWQPVFLSLVNGNGATTTITPEQVALLQNAFHVFESLGSPTLRAALERQEALLDVPGYAGLTADQARTKLESVAPPAVVLPVATSVHGLAGSFFHSDIRVLNPSDTSPVTVAARYRCAAASCGAAEQTFTLAPGELRSLDDAVADLFGAPETFGAIEFTGDVFVDSRIYTPSRPSPTNGMYAPGQTMDEAYPESVLLALSHSENPAAGFRTNVGVYNGNDLSLTVSFDLFEASGALLGSVTRDVPARTTVQVNDVFTAASVSGDVSAAYAVVRSDGVHELFAYAAVIDNQTQDPFLIRGRDNRAYESGGSSLRPPPCTASEAPSSTPTSTSSIPARTEARRSTPVTGAPAARAGTRSRRSCSRPGKCAPSRMPW